MNAVRPIQWPADQNAILDHMRVVYSAEDYDTLATAYGHTPAFDPADCFVIDGDKGKIAAHGMLIPRHVQIGMSVLPTAEIGALSVLDEYQEHTLELALLDALHGRMAEREDVLALAFGDPVLYEGWGYVAAAGLYLTRYESLITLDQALNAGQWDMQRSYDRRTTLRLGASNQPVMVRRFYLNDLPAVQVLYAADSARGHYLLARDEAAWTWQIDHLTHMGRNEPDDFLVAEVEGQIVAYVRLVTQEPVNQFRGAQAVPFSVIEACGAHPDGVEALLAQIGHTAQTFGMNRIGLFVHPASVLMQHALARGAELRHFTGAGFMRLNDLLLALYQLQPTLDARRADSRFAPRAVRLIVTTEHQQADVQLGVGELEEVKLEVPTTTLLRLITGWVGIDALHTGYHERHRDLLRVLFPQRDPKIGMADVM
ncbi:MAG: GNAT family N-acetyltransferase [Anaerolineae bacterium]|nr:GNAT family N-acetyltransferase [Anaerolineae bacterium]